MGYAHTQAGLDVNSIPRQSSDGKIFINGVCPLSKHLTPRTTPCGSWDHVAVVPQGRELRKGKDRCDEPICSRGWPWEGLRRR